MRWAPRAWRDGVNSWTANGAPVEDEPVAGMIGSGMRADDIAAFLDRS